MWLFKSKLIKAINEERDSLFLPATNYFQCQFNCNKKTVFSVQLRQINSGCGELDELLNCLPVHFNFL